MAKQQNDNQVQSKEEPIRVSGRFAYEGLERVIHERSRLGILSSLAAHPKGLLFNDLKELCSLTDGNLSRQIQLLQESGFVEVWKGYNNNRPQTLCRLTQSGQERFLEYIGVLEEVVQNAARTAKHDVAGVDVLPEGLSTT
ncbi:MAG TPA: transcriptional regulator [Tepidisphaeraceae bacterium]|nr:transcriptional regulator [Tepidisphaeraceae bacterium]